MSKTPCLAALLALSLLTVPLASRADAAGNSMGGMPARLIVRFAEDPASVRADGGEHAGALAASVDAQAQAQARVDRLAARAGRPLRYVRALGTGAWLVDAGSDLDPAALDALANRLRRGGGLLSIEPDRLMRASLTPNDPYYPSQWDFAGPAQSIGIAGMNLGTAWDRSTGNGAVIAIIDTGYRPHVDLAGQVVAQYDFVSDPSNGNDGDGRDTNAQDPGDFRAAGACGGAPAANSSWHGTHVAGTVAALTNNAVGVAGVAPAAKLVIARVLGRCGGMSSDIIDAIVWASGGSVAGVPANPSPAQVINASLGGAYPCSSSPELQAAINSARGRNTTVVVAAGNANADVAGFSPAGCSGVITVAATGDSGARAPYSNFGSGVSLAAPGGDMSGGRSLGILSTHNGGTTTPGADTYAYMQGTSMASPHVAGLAALLYSLNSGITPDQVLARLKTTVRPFPAGCSGCGAGLADASLATASIVGPPSPPSPPSPPTPPSMLAVAAAGYSVGEAAGSVTVTVNRSGGRDGAVSVTYTTVNATAVAGSDFTSTSGTLSWAAGDMAAKTIRVPVLNDSVPEPAEAFTVVLSGASGATLATANTATVSIVDDDRAGVFAFADSAPRVGEKAGILKLTVTRTGGNTGAASVSYATADGTAIAGKNYKAASGSLNWPAGDSSSRTITITIIDDKVRKPNQTFQVRLSSPTLGTLGTMSSSTIMILEGI